MKINLVISSYAAKYSVVDKKNYLKYNLSLLNKINTDITQITIMKPRINVDHMEYVNYYNFDSIDISNIKHKIVIMECENIGISYGQFFTAIKHNLDFDYHIFLEDDYTGFMDNFEQCLVDQLVQIQKDAYLCMFYFKDKKWNLSQIIQRESFYTQNQFIEKIKTYNIYDKYTDDFTVPDNSLGIISKKSVEKILKTFTSFDIINDIFDIKFGGIWIHQILFGYILYVSGIDICDISNKNINLFYHTGGNVTMCNYGSDLQKWKEYSYNKKLEIPVFVPLEFLYQFNHDDTILYHLKKYFIDYDKFIERYTMLFLEMKNLVTTLS